MIDRQIAQIARFAEDLMDAIRVDHGALRVSKVPVDIVAVLAAPLSAAALAAAQRNQAFNVRIADRAIRVEGDPIRLAQAVSNLLHNAVKYTPEHGCITVTCSPITTFLSYPSRMMAWVYRMRSCRTSRPVRSIQQDDRGECRRLGCRSRCPSKPSPSRMAGRCRRSVLALALGVNSRFDCPL